MSEPLYSVGTWDTYEQAYSPQEGLSVPSFNISKWTLLQAMRELRECGYSCHRYKDTGESDPNVLIERTDGMSESDILESWKH